MKDDFVYHNCQETYIVVSRYTMISVTSSRRSILYNVIDCLDAYAVSNIISIYEEGVFSLM